MRPRLLPILLALSAAALAFATLPVALEASVREPARSALKGGRDLWATINVCDTAAKPDTVGIRGSMPGLARWSRAAMRFQVQYLASTDGRWHAVPEGGDSGWKPLGRLRGHVVEAGQDFAFQAPASGAHHLRGVVRFRWMRGRHVVRRARRVTEAGHRSTAGADPAGYSAAVCDIT